MIHSIILNVSILLSSAATVQSFVPNNQRIGVGPHPATYLPATADASGRRDFLRDGALAGAAVLSVPFGCRTLPARADAVEDRLNIPRALRDLRKTREQLVRAEAQVKASDYAGVASALQRPPFSDFRRNTRVLLRTLGEDTPERLALQRNFEEFVAACEKLSTRANKGMRGSKVDMQDAYAAVLVALDGLLEYAGKIFPSAVAAEAVPSPSPAPSLPAPEAAPAPFRPELSTAAPSSPVDDELEAANRRIGELRAKLAAASAPSSPVVDDLEAANKRIGELRAKLAVIENLTR